MSAPSHRGGAILAGGLLLFMPAMDVLVAGTPATVLHLAVASFGAALLAWSFALRPVPEKKLRHGAQVRARPTAGAGGPPAG